MRRARIKPVANLAATRRSASKCSSDALTPAKEKDIQSQKSEQNDVVAQSDLELSAGPSQPDVSASVSSQLNDSAIEEEKVSEKVLEVDPAAVASTEKKPTTGLEHSLTSQDEPSTFKTPLQMPRAESDSSISSASQSSVNKFRRFKVAPRLNTLRNVPKVQESDDAIRKPDEIALDPMRLPQPGYEHDQVGDFTPPTPTRARPDTPRDVNDIPLFMTNHNVAHPGAPPSPFPYHSMGRIRTESLCSIKSNREFTVANLQPRKNIRTEDQKIIDIKRESRERLSNKDLDKSQLRMFDMIYFNPQNNPMKPRSPHKNDKPKKIDLVQEAPPVPEIKKESSAMPVPQLRLNANGEMVLDETSLVVENEQQKQNRILLANTNIVYDDEMSGHYGYYKRQQRTKEWSHEETVKFYRCLNTVGTDFSLMLNLFPNRSRRDLKLKFKKEERNNPQLVDKALLKHNTFDLDELQRELDQEEEDRRKEAEARSNTEIKQLVKRKILKKQELKAHLQSKTKLEKMLTGGELAMSVVDENSQLDVKENLGIPLDSSVIVRKKREYKRKIKSEGEGAATVVQEIILDLSQKFHALADLVGATQLDPPVIKRARIPRKKMVNNNSEAAGTSDSSQPPTKKPRKNRKKEDVVVQQMSEIDDAINNMIHKEFNSISTPKPDLGQLSGLTSEMNHSMITNQPKQSEFKNETSHEVASLMRYEELPIDEVQSQYPVFQMPSSAVSTAIYYVTDFMQATTEAQTTEAQPAYYDGAHTFEEVYIEASVVPNTQQISSENFVFEMPDQPSTVQEEDKVLDYPTEASLEHPTEDIAPTVASISLMEKSSDKKSKGKSRKRKYKPALVTRLKLDANGEMVLDDPSVETPPPEIPTIPVIHDPVAVQNQDYEMPSEYEENLNQLENNEEIPVDENLNETKVDVQLQNEIIPEMSPNDDQIPSTSTESAFDGEAFLDSLDLENLALVQAQRDGKDVYEIHEMDPVTQEIGDMPLDLPARYVDLIIKIMLQEQEDENE